MTVLSLFTRHNSSTGNIADYSRGEGKRDEGGGEAGRKEEWNWVGRSGGQRLLLMETNSKFHL